MLGQTISHYQITDKLGAGGMGVVYKPNDLTVSERDKQGLLREARAASVLDHPNIGVIHGIEESEEHQLFIVMGYYEGETLAQKLSRGVIPVRESLDLAIQIARGLSSAHARNIVHRDVKPSNIIITHDQVAKIVDFGLARVVATAGSTQSISSTGTLPYMAPEQILGEAIDQRCDIWALGAILIQMITGSQPFVRPNKGAMTYAILNQPPVALDVVPQAVQPVAYRALSKKAEGRYPGADEMLRDLEASLAEITSTPPQTGNQRSRAPSMHAHSSTTLRMPPRRAGRGQTRESPAFPAGIRWSGLGRYRRIFSSSAARTPCGTRLCRRREAYRGTAVRQFRQRSRIRPDRGRADGLTNQRTVEPGGRSAIALGGSRQCSPQSPERQPYARCARLHRTEGSPPRIMRLLALKDDHGVCHPPDAKSSLAIQAIQREYRQWSKLRLPFAAQDSAGGTRRTHIPEAGLCSNRVCLPAEKMSLPNESRVELLGTGTVSIWSSREPIVSD